MTQSIDSPLAVIKSALQVLKGACILDVGCGDGGLARVLSLEGCVVTGVDPSAEAVARARTNAPGVGFEQAGAEALPFSTGCFDAVVLMNSLHHIPLGSMDQALSEAVRVLKANSPLIVIEPVAEGSYFAALRVVDDESAVYRAAQAALARLLGRGQLKLKSTSRFTSRETFEDIDQFFASMIAVDPSREEVVHMNRAAIAASVMSAATRLADGRFALDESSKADVMLANVS